MTSANQSHKRKWPIVIAILASVSVAVVAFQNCAGGFAPNPSLGRVAGLSSTDPNDGAPLGPPATSGPNGPGAPVATPPGTTPGGSTPPGSTATPPALKPVVASYLYVGGQGRIRSYKIDHSNDAMTVVADTTISGQTPGWFDFDPQANRLFVANASGNGLLTSYSFTPGTGALGFERTTPFIAGAVHLTINRGAQSYFAIGASYNGANWAKWELPLDVSRSTRVAEFGYSRDAKSHSSSYDQSRQLSFVANLGENRIVVYRDQNGVPVEVGEIQVDSPRIVLYDEIYDKLYIASETYTTAGYAYVYGIRANGNSFTFPQLASWPTALRGADLKIDRVHNVVGTTVREANKEGLWLFPVGANGLPDSTRQNRFVPIAQKEARSLAISADGRYYVVTMNNGDNEADVLVYKVSYGAGTAITNVQLIHEVNVGSGSYPSHQLISVRP